MEPNQKDLLPKKSNKHFDRRLLKQAVQEVEEGVSRSEVLKRYNISGDTLLKWLNRFGSADYHANKRPKISMLTKRSVVSAVQTGRLTIPEAQIAYKLKDPRSIKQWISLFKQQSTYSEVVNCVDMSKKQELKTPEQLEIEALKKALEYAELKLLATNTLIDVAEQQFKITIRKKPGAKQ